MPPSATHFVPKTRSRWADKRFGDQWTIRPTSKTETPAMVAIWSSTLFIWRRSSSCSRGPPWRNGLLLRECHAGDRELSRTCLGHMNRSTLPCATDNATGTKSPVCEKHALVTRGSRFPALHPRIAETAFSVEHGIREQPIALCLVAAEHEADVVKLLGAPVMGRPCDTQCTPGRANAQ